MRCSGGTYSGVFLSDNVFLLSKNTGDPTVGSLRDKKESCSTRRGLRVGTGFREFPQTLRGRGFSLLEFIPVLSTLQMFESKEAVRGRLIGPKTWDRIIGNFFGIH